MFRSYLKTAWRSFRRGKGHSLIIVAGLAVGMAGCLLIFRFVAFERGFDRFHENARDLYRVLQSTPLRAEGFSEPGGAYTGFALAPALSGTVPEILRIARLHPEYDAATVSDPTRPDRAFEETEAFYADPAFLEMFTFPLVAGERGSALRPGTALVSESAARKYFGDADPLGRSLDVAGQIRKTYRVTGVFRDVPPNSHLTFDFLFPVEDLIREDYAAEPEQGWSWNNFSTYVQLRPGADPAEAERKMTAVYLDRRGDALRSQGRTARLWAQPLRDIHLNAAISGPRAVMGSSRTVDFFTLIGLVTLIIALVNYVNLATARALDRAREVGLRKTAGAERKQLIVQFLLETALVTIFAAVLAVAAAVLLSPWVDRLAEVTPGGRIWRNAGFWAAFASTLAGAVVLAGLQPALVLSSFKPSAVMRAKIGASGAQLRLRRALVVLQFAASVVLVGGTAVVYDQLRYLGRMDLGMDLERVVSVDGPRVLRGGTERRTAMTAFADELRRLPAVRGLALSTSLPGQGFNWNGCSTRRATADPASVIRGVVTYVDRSFLDLYGLRLAAGSGFVEGTRTVDQEGPWSVLANETAAKALGFATADAAVGEALDLGGRPARIVGVVKDFSWSSAHEPRQNVFFGYHDAGRRVSLRVAGGDLPATIAAVRASFDRLFPGNVFRYAFVDDLFDRQYRNDRRFAKLFTVFAGLAIAIACLGLFGLASFSTRQRTKEIGVRKVLGASVPGLIGLLSLDFVKLVFAGLVVGSPLAVLAMRGWLDRFAYHVAIGPALFLRVAAVSLLAAFLTVAWQCLRAARNDPVRCLKDE